MSAADPNVVDPASRRPIISFGKNAGNHNGGTIAFGPDGYLYLANWRRRQCERCRPEPHRAGRQCAEPDYRVGQDAADRSAQPDADTGQPEPGEQQRPVPHSDHEPVHGAGQVREIYAYGFRNPYRFAFDRANGDLILADVGQNNIEEIDRVTIGGNYGWAVKEGDFLFDRARTSERRLAIAARATRRA